MAPCFIGLGSNIGDPLTQLRRAAHDLYSHTHIQQMALSSVYRSTPMGPQDQPDFLNAVARLETHLSPEALLDVLQSLERGAERVRGRRWGPRTLDLDLLLYGEETIVSPRLTVPHPGLETRDFVLMPLRDISGAEFMLPGGQTVAQALARCPDSAVQQIAGAACLWRRPSGVPGT
ncbi:MAG: 2-amino-4-hydroxy-6-hydroxymethyldihydropteridine diphosphokinase [Chromatocurvus sp.]